MKYNLFIITITTLLIIPLASAKEGHIKLLAVSDDGKNLTGSVADLYLEIQEGKGRVFLETFPLTKTDTQITTRFAKEIACKHADIDCTKYDFFYTIKADSAIIGGPSAGAATTVLTVAMLKGYELDTKAAITGTINSGEIIGVVSGLKQKIEAAKEANLTRVLIAKGAELITEKNQTINLTELGRSIGVEVVQVSDVDEAMEAFAGIKARKVSDVIKVDPTYTDVMKGLADELCGRSRTFSGNITNLTQKADTFYEKGHYYSSASQCFGANVRLREQELLERNLTRAAVAKEALTLLKQIQDYDKNITAIQRNTITDLEAYMIAKERLLDAARSLSEIPSTSTDEDIQTLAYAYERLQSAVSWSSFFGKGGRSFILDQESLKSSCLEKVSEAQERFEYVFSILPQDLSDIKKDIESANNYQNEGNYELCLFTASKAKARVNTILSSLYTSSEELNATIDLKLVAVRKVISKQVENGLFPILGYSYYEYAQDLKEDEPYLSFFYTEYALETSNLDLYFKPRKSAITEPFIDAETIKRFFIFAVGLVLGGLFIYFWQNRHKRTKVR